MSDDLQSAEEAAQFLAVANAAMRAREEILAVVSHDLRSPLGTITSALQLLSLEVVNLAPEDGSRLRKYLDTIARSTARMTRLASDLLDVARIDAGGFSIHPRPRALGDAVRETFESYGTRARKKNVRLRSEVEPGLPPLVYDKDRLLQVLGNLVSNALRLTSPGGDIWIRARRWNQTVVVSVEDNGRGIAPDVLKHVFERRWSAPHRAGSAHGLGLAVSKAIIEAHGGSIVAESRMGEGTSVSFSLPVPMPGVVSARAPQNGAHHDALAASG